MSIGCSVRQSVGSRLVHHENVSQSTQHDSFVHLIIHSFNHSFIHSFFHSFVHSFIRSFVHSFFHSFLYSVYIPSINLNSKTSFTDLQCSPVQSTAVQCRALQCRALQCTAEASSMNPTHHTSVTSLAHLPRFLRSIRHLS